MSNKCPNCNGRGWRSLSGIAITQEDWDSWSAGEQESYMQGAYDEVCDLCDGKGTATEDQIEFYVMEQHERRMGY